MTNTDNRELAVTCHIAAAPPKVWQIMTDRLTEWWCPKPWSTEIVEIDWRAGGRCATVMRGPNGEVMPNEGVVLEYTPGQRFAFTDALTVDLQPSGPFMIGIFEIAPENDGTRYTARARHWTQEAVEQHRAMGFEEGWGVVAQQLKALAEA